MFSNLNPFLETIITGIIAYVAIILVLRLSGKRTLAKWNSFDFVVTIALGSVFASVLLSTKDAFGKGILGFALLVLLQYIITWISVRTSVIQKLIKSEPALLLYRGEMQHDVMKKERIAEGEVLAALRTSGVSAVEDADAVILETDGSFSVIKNIDDSSASALKDVREFDRTKMARAN
ncbi:DUF421 domain-containing protein [Pleurocapsa sp. PCC 7319]|uniref:DUF421 domain-containing protein n=1 Tax=Pleurocapsa sp. PCC 7319 TaxID=118161 RepID=UPI00034C8E83|nr:YetF domain-containing protein [Pleurocapsa sp. PCC 7319]